MGRIKQVFSDCGPRKKRRGSMAARRSCFSAFVGRNCSQVVLDTKSGILSRLVYNTRDSLRSLLHQIDYSDVATRTV
jgi:hypothetical protein